MRKLILMSLFVCSTLCYAQEDDPFGLYKKGTSKSKNYDLEKVYEVKDRPKPFIGLNVGLGGNFGKGFSTLEGSIGLDMARSINDRFSMGCYLSYQTITAASFGLLFVHGNHNENHAFLWGIGYSSPEFLLRDKENNIEIDYLGNVKYSPNLRFGFMLKNGLYFMTDMELSVSDFCVRGNDIGEYYRSMYGLSYGEAMSFDINFRIGFKLNSKKRK